MVAILRRPTHDRPEDDRPFAAVAEDFAAWQARAAAIDQMLDLMAETCPELLAMIADPATSERALAALTRSLRVVLDAHEAGRRAGEGERG